MPRFGAPKYELRSATDLAYRRQLCLVCIRIHSNHSHLHITIDARKGVMWTEGDTNTVIRHVPHYTRTEIHTLCFCQAHRPKKLLHIRITFRHEQKFRVCERGARHDLDILYSSTLIYIL